MVADNLGSHKGARVRRALRAAGAKLVFLPPYRPDLNPIEMVFSKSKTLFRKHDARTVEAATIASARSWTRSARSNASDTSPTPGIWRLETIMV